MPWRSIPNDFPMGIGDAVRVENAGAVQFYGANGHIVFHWDPQSSRQQVIRNSKDPSLGTEERGGGWPFSLAAEDTILTRTTKGWGVTIGGVRKPTFDFAQRTKTAVSRILTYTPTGGLVTSQFKPATGPPAPHTTVTAHTSSPYMPSATRW